MVKAHSPINWENEPSFNTPINEANLNKMDKTIGVLDDRIIEQETSKLDKSIAYTMVKDISFNENNGVFTVTRLNGSTFTIDTRLEKIAINFKYDYSTQKLIVTLIDGTTQSIDMSALLTQYEFTDSATLDFSTDSNGKVTATIKNGSITEDMLQPNYLAEIKVETAKSAQSMANAQISENNAKQSELNAKASEEQALEYSNNAQPLAQSVSGNNPTATNSADGSVIYLNNKGYTQQDGTPSPDNPIRIGGLADKGYFDGVLQSGYYASGSGNYNPDSSNPIDDMCCKNPIKVNGNDSVVISYDGEISAIRCLYYDESDAFIATDLQGYTDASGTISKAEFTTPSNCKFIRFNFFNVAGITPSTAKHISVTINGQYAVRVKTCGKNILPIATWSSEYAGYVYDKYPINLNGDYVLSMKASGSSGALSMSVYDDNDNRILYKVIGYTDETVSFNVSGGKKFSLYVNDKSITISDIQLEQGTVATPYEPHQETEALIPVSAPFYGGDYIEVYADGTGREYWKMATTVFNGTTNGFVLADGADLSKRRMYSNAIKDMVKKPPNFSTLANIKSTHYTAITASETYFAIQGIAVDHNGTVYLYDDTYHTSASELNTWLQSNPVTVVYELAKPTSTPLTAEQVAEFLKLRTYKGVTYVTADGEVVMRYYCDNASGETVSMLQSSLPQTYSREFEWLSPKLGHVQYFDFYFDKSYSKPPMVIPAVRGAGANGVIPHVSYVNKEKCRITLYNAVDYSGDTMPVMVDGNVDILVY